MLVLDVLVDFVINPFTPACCFLQSRTDGCVILKEQATFFVERHGGDRTIHGFKKMMKTDPEQTHERADIIIKNTYRVLMIHWMKGCYVYCEDEGLREYIRGRIGQKNQLVST